jgi:phenylacetate-CoA ligase
MSPRPEIASFLKALDQTQYLPADRMRAYQRRLLEALLRHARAETDFYADRLAPVFRADDTINWDRWHDIPVVTRKDVQENFAPLTARSLPKMAGDAIEDISSGSTGRPVRHLQTSILHIASLCANERFFRWHGMEPMALMARIRATTHPEAAYPIGRTITGWRIDEPDSRAIDLSIAATPEQQLEWLGRMAPRHLVSYPSNLRELARVAAAAGDHIHVERVLTWGEMVTDDAREAIEQHFGMAPLDRYGASETGSLAFACPHSHKLHLASELVLFELLDDDDRPVPAGVPGRVVVTPFYNLAMPLVRYAIGDHAVLSAEPCPCGRTLPVIDKVLGRTRNIFRFVDGTALWPVLLSREINRHVPIRQFQAVQTSPTEIDFRYVPVDPDQANDFAGLEAYIRSRLHASITVRPVAVTSIDRSPGGKFEDCISLVEPAGSGGG